MGAWAGIKCTLCVLIASLALTASVQACTEDAMLDLIGSLEAPDGYDQVYSGVRVNPPRPITSMSVGEVIAWQRQASKTAVSSAAGRYQVIRATLQNMVESGVVSLDARFDARTQDRIGRHLLHQTGYRAGETSPAVANRIAGVWAALPQVSGPRRGASTYEGIAGNHALVDATSYQKFLACEIDLAAVGRVTASIRNGLRFGMTFDALIAALQSNSESAITRAAEAAQILLLIFLAIDLVWRGGQSLIGNAPLADYIADTFFKIFVVMFFLFILRNAAVLAEGLGRWGAQTGEAFSGREGFSLGGYARDKFVLMFQYHEGVRFYPFPVKTTVSMFTLMTCVVMALTMAKVVQTYARLMFTSMVGMIVISMGSLSPLTAQARRVIMKLIGVALEIIALNMILYLALDLAQETSSDVFPVVAAAQMFVLDAFVMILAWTLPGSLAKLARSR